MTTTVYGSTASTGSAWASFVSSVSASGTPGSFAGSGTIYYKVLGKSVIFYADLTVTTLSTATGTMDFTMPVNNLRNGTVFMGINKSTGQFFYAAGGANSPTFNCLASGGAFAVTGDGQFLSVSGIFESV